MCGIVAIVNLSAPGGSDSLAARERDLLSMLGMIQHRGDAEHFAERRLDDRIALGTNRLAIVDREHARQPMSDDRGDVWVVYNGELYGSETLRRELSSRGCRFRTKSDTELLIHAYLEWGDAFVNRLDGMFAFVLYDRRTSSVLAARDHIGIKPLYGARRHDTWFFASEQKCLLQCGGKIETIEPGTYLKDGRAVRYFRLNSIAPTGTEREIVARFKTLFVEAVKKQVETDLPVAVMFSGGIDSAAVLHIARRYHANVTAFTVGFPGASDIDVARRYCQEYGVRQVVAHLDRAEMIDVLPRVIYGSEFFEAIDVMDACVGYFAYQLVRKAGIKVALCGEGSDEVLAGYDLFRTHPDPADLMRYRVHNLHRTDLQRVDRSSMLHGVEARVPFLDRPLLEFAYALPMHFKLRDGVEKWILRRAFDGDLPIYISTRPKVRMPEGSGLKNLLVDYACMAAESRQAEASAIEMDTRQGAFFLRQYLTMGFPVPGERFKRPGYDYSPNGYFDFA